jgi:hypothetical protein
LFFGELGDGGFQLLLQFLCLHDKLGVFVFLISVGAFLLESQNDLLVLFGIKEKVVGDPEQERLGFFGRHFFAFPPKPEVSLLHEVFGLIDICPFVTKEIAHVPGVGEKQFLVNRFLTDHI